MFTLTAHGAITQGHKRDDLPRGEYLMQGALDALELTVKFVKSPRQ
jgi:hypothetical protein